MPATEKYNCSFCGSEAEKYSNYCSWDCQIAEAKASGGTVYTPNNLPIKCMKHDGSMYEHEDADHPGYKFPIYVEYDEPFEVTAGDHHWVESGETHALIFSDDCLAISLYEARYYFWSLKRGRAYHKNPEPYQLGTKLSTKAIQDIHNGNYSVTPEGNDDEKN